jgi:FAD-dependent urate hydroxylase
MRDIRDSKKNDRPITALIIGGGIAGPVTAMALQRAGITATVFEAYGSSADSVGGALQLAPNGINAMKVLDLDGLIAEHGVATPRAVMQSGNGKVLADIGTLPGLPTPQTLARGDLYRVLLAEARRRGIEVETGKRLVTAVDNGQFVTAWFADGSEATGDILIGADGIRSVVRTLIDPAAPQPRYAGLLGFGGWVDNSGVPSTRGGMHFVFGRRAFFGYQVEDCGRALWFGNVVHPEPLTAAQVKAIPASEWLDKLKALYADDNTPALRILSQVRPEGLVATGAMEDISTIPVWHRGRMVLVGDSAHPTSPSSGQGASLATESAIQLARCLRDLSTVEEAFTAYEGLRRERVEKIIAGAARVNNDKAAGPIARVIRDLMFPLAMRTFYSPAKMFGWQHNYRIDWSETVR